MSTPEEQVERFARLIQGIPPEKVKIELGFKGPRPKPIETKQQPVVQPPKEETK